MYDLDGGSLAPWETGHSLGARPLRPRERWRHTVYCGVFEREAAFELIRERFPTNSESFDGFPAKGDCGLAAFVVSDDGRPIVGSELLSAARGHSAVLSTLAPRTPAGCRALRTPRAR